MIYVINVQRNKEITESVYRILLKGIKLSLIKIDVAHRNGASKNPVTALIILRSESMERI